MEELHEIVDDAMLRAQTPPELDLIGSLKQISYNVKNFDHATVTETYSHVHDALKFLYRVDSTAFTGPEFGNLAAQAAIATKLFRSQNKVPRHMSAEDIKAYLDAGPPYSEEKTISAIIDLAKKFEKNRFASDLLQILYGVCENLGPHTSTVSGGLSIRGAALFACVIAYGAAIAFVLRHIGKKMMGGKINEGDLLIVSFLAGLTISAAFCTAGLATLKKKYIEGRGVVSKLILDSLWDAGMITESEYKILKMSVDERNIFAANLRNELDGRFAANAHVRPESIADVKCLIGLDRRSLNPDVNHMRDYLLRIDNAAAAAASASAAAEAASLPKPPDEVITKLYAIKNTIHGIITTHNTTRVISEAFNLLLRVITDHHPLNQLQIQEMDATNRMMLNVYRRINYEAHEVGSYLANYTIRDNLKTISIPTSDELQSRAVIHNARSRGRRQGKMTYEDSVLLNNQLDVKKRARICEQYDLIITPKRDRVASHPFKNADKGWVYNYDVLNYVFDIPDVINQLLTGSVQDSRYKTIPRSLRKIIVPRNTLAYSALGGFTPERLIYEKIKIYVSNPGQWAATPKDYIGAALESAVAVQDQDNYAPQKFDGTSKLALIHDHLNYKLDKSGEFDMDADPETLEDEYRNFKSDSISMDNTLENTRRLQRLAYLIIYLFKETFFLSNGHVVYGAPTQIQRNLFAPTERASAPAFIAYLGNKLNLGRTIDIVDIVRRIARSAYNVLMNPDARFTDDVRLQIINIMVYVSHFARSRVADVAAASPAAAIGGMRVSCTLANILFVVIVVLIILLVYLLAEKLWGPPSYFAISCTQQYPSQNLVLASCT